MKLRQSKPGKEETEDFFKNHYETSMKKAAEQVKSKMIRIAQIFFCKKKLIWNNKVTNEAQCYDTKHQKHKHQ